MRRRFTVLPVLLAALVLAGPVAARDATDDGFSLGAGIVVAPRPYAGVGAEIVPVPLVQYRRGGFYVQGIEVGYRWLRRSPFLVAVFARPAFDGYDSGDSRSLAGMRDRKPSVVAGFALGLSLRRFELALSSAEDVIDRSDGRRTSFALRWPRKLGAWLVTPGVSTVRLDDRWVDYYYGVEAAEAVAGRPAYRGGATRNWALSLQAVRPIGRWSLFARVEGESFGSGIARSPIVDDDEALGGVLGLLYRF